MVSEEDRGDTEFPLLDHKFSNVTMMEKHNKKELTVRLKTFDSFSVPAYRTHYVSMAANWFAMNMLLVVRVLLVYRLTHSPAAAGGLALANAIPMLLVSIFGGSIGDRFEKKRIMLIVRSGLVVCTLGIAVLLSAGYMNARHPHSWLFLVVSAVFEGAIFGFLWPISMSIIPELVSVKQVMNAIFLSTTGINVFRIVGPAMAGYLVDVSGFTVVFYLITALCATSTLLTLLLPSTGVIAIGSGGPLSDTVNGFSYLRREHTMLAIVVFAVCHIISGQPFQQLFPVYTESVLKISASKMGMLTSLSGAGAMIGSLVLASFPLRKRGLMLLLSGIVLGLPIVAFTCFHQWWIAIVVMPLTGLGMAMHGGFTSTLVQIYAKPEYRSRMQSFVAVASGLAGFGTFIAGILAEVIGIKTAIGISAFLLTLVSVLFMVLAKGLRSLD